MPFPSRPPYKVVRQTDTARESTDSQLVTVEKGSGQCGLDVLDAFFLQLDQLRAPVSGPCAHSKTHLEFVLCGEAGRGLEAPG